MTRNRKSLVLATQWPRSGYSAKLMGIVHLLARGESCGHLQTKLTKPRFVMIRSTLLLLCVLPSLASAQVAPNRHLFYPRETAATPFFLDSGPSVSIGRVGGSQTVDIEALSDVSAAAFRGVGSTSTSSCSLVGQTYLIYDQDAAVQDNYRLVVRKAVAPDGLPDVTSTGAIAISANIKTPVGTGAVLWQISATWTTPVTVPCENGYYVGLGLPPWNATLTDGCFAASANALGAAGVGTGDNPRLPAPKFHAVRVDNPSTTPVATRTTTARTLAVVSDTAAATMNVGNIDPTQTNYKSYALGGLYPSATATRGDGLTVRVQDSGNAGGLTAVFLSTGFLPGGFTLPSFTGAIWLNPAILIQVASGSLNAAAPFTFETTFAPPGSVPTVSGLALAFQAATVSTSFTNGRLTNAQSVSF